MALLKRLFAVPGRGEDSEKNITHGGIQHFAGACYVV